MLEQVKEIVKYHRSEKCFKCETLVEKNEEGYFHCSNCDFEWANLFIKRIPIQPFLVFKELADREFCSDYGMCFREIINNNQLLSEMSAILQMHEARLNKLESKPEKEIKTLSGKIIKIRKEEENE